MICSFIYRFFDAIVRRYRKARFSYEIKCRHKEFKLVGSVTVINRNITLGHNVVIYPDTMFWGDGPIVIGDNVVIGNQTIIYASKTGGVTIGADTHIAAQCYIIDMDHGIAAGQAISKQKGSIAPVIIGKDVWIGANVTILKGSVIDDGTVIGAKSLVKGHIRENSVAVGIPAKVIKKR